MQAKGAGRRGGENITEQTRKVASPKRQAKKKEPIGEVDGQATHPMLPADVLQNLIANLSRRPPPDIPAGRPPLVRPPVAPYLREPGLAPELPRQALLFNEKADFGFTSRGFLASNEFDWSREELDLRPADTIAGIGNNGVWDLAMRRNARFMVIGDHDEEVIRAQEFLYKPLALIAKSPAEFVSMLAGIPISNTIESADKAFQFIDLVIEQKKEKQELGTEVERAFIDEISQRIAAHPKLSKDHANFVHHHLSWMWSPARAAGLGNVPYGGAFAGAFGGKSKDNPYWFFRARYCESELIKAGGDPKRVKDPRFSVLSSMDSFRWLQNAFLEDRVRYFVADVTDKRAWEAVGRELRAEGRKLSGLATTNVFDYLSKIPARVASLSARTIDSVMTSIDTDKSFTVYATRGCRPPHGYELYTMSKREEIEAALEKGGMNGKPIEPRSDFEMALRALDGPIARVSMSPPGFGPPTIHIGLRSGYVFSVVGAPKLPLDKLPEYLGWGAHAAFAEAGQEPPTELWGMPGDRLVFSNRLEAQLVIARALERVSELSEQAPRVGEFLRFIGLTSADLRAFIDAHPVDRAAS
jgi:hypothetical protein